jgi:Mor family transcriptional regulator
MGRARAFDYGVALALYQGGHACREIGELLGQDPRTVRNAVVATARVQGVVLRNVDFRRPNNKSTAPIYESYQDGMAALALARQHGLSKQRIYQIVKAEARRRGESLRPKLGPGGVCRVPLPAQIYERYLGGESLDVLALECGRSKSATYQALLKESRRRGQRMCEYRPRVMPSLRKLPYDVLYRRYQDGESSTALAREYGVSDASVYMAVANEARRRGQALRPRLPPFGQGRQRSS